jgi:hypothetical protein
MPITFHCTHCRKKIEAPDNAGGKWGKCPACHNKVYVPSPPSDEDELKLAPIDENEEEKKRQLMAETYSLSRRILEERETLQSGEGPKPAVRPASSMSEKQLTKNIILYLRLMADGDLEEAQSTENLITPYGSRAIAILDAIAISQMPEPELADIPPQVLSGLVRTLRAKIV